MENSMEVPQKLKIDLPSDLAIPLLSIYPKVKAETWRGICTPMFIICNALQVGGMQVFADGWTDKVVYTVVCSSALKRKFSDTLSETGQSQKDKYW